VNRSVSRQDDGIHTRPLARPQDCPEISGIGNAVNGNEEQLVAAINACQHFVEQRLFQWLRECNHSLRCLTTCLIVDFPA
jgi:hypothetical protein